MSSSVSLSIVLIFVSMLLIPSLASGLHNAPRSGGGGGGGEDHVVVPLRRSVVGASEGNTSFVLAAERTQRKDPLNGFRDYTGGWNISNQHYWASVSFTAAPLFAVAGVWFLGFGLVLFFICCCFCCCPGRSYSYSRAAYALSLMLLILFTAAAVIGCIVLYNGQGKFHDTTSSTLNYVIGQADITVANLRNFSSYLATAKTTGVRQIFLPSTVQTKIDEVVVKVNASANELASRTSNNSGKIQNGLDTVRLALIIVAAVMLLLSFLGFLLSILGLQCLVYILVLLGWILIAGTLILCGIFLLLHNVVADACVAMDEWVLHPHEHTALDDILPCVDAATVNESLNQSKQVAYSLISVVNNVITNVSNVDYPPQLAPLYYNQSGPPVPVLCNPYMPDMSSRTCAAGEVGFDSAPQAWRKYVCSVSVVSGSETCSSVGRLTPTLYNQMTGVANVSYGLHHYGPIFADLANCKFVREAFRSISENNCPGLGRYSSQVYVGLVIVSAAVMLSLIFWVVYGRERRHRKHSKQQQFIARSDQHFVQEKPLLRSPR
uniref:Transmembrane protein n=1 Tax=Ananas comosus var. bracteatus TaxID=296719 RepID=A0A6V7QAB9_ANACO|nr:unnamed protein product [Ananas comosus var. bracteatus]